MKGVIILDITVNSNAFVKLDKMVGLSEVDIKISDYILQNNTLKGNVKIFGEYYTDDLEYENNNGLKEFEDLVSFEIVFSKEDPVINQISINNFEYYELAGRGIETSFDLEISYDVTNKMDENESIKEEVTKQIDDLLEEKLELRNDNFLEEIDNTQIVEENKRTYLNSKPQDNKGTIKVIYYNKNQEVKDVCKKHNLSYYNVIEENKKYRFNDNYRIIISEQHGNK